MLKVIQVVIVGAIIGATGVGFPIGLLIAIGIDWLMAKPRHG